MSIRCQQVWQVTVLSFTVHRFLVMVWTFQAGPKTLCCPPVSLQGGAHHHLDNPDTEYKQDVFTELQKSFNAGMMKVKDGLMQGRFQIIFGDEIKAKRPKPGGKKPARRSR